MGSFTIYTFGNLDAIYNILMSIATFFGGGTFLSMVKLAGVTTILLFLFNAVGITAKGNISQPLDLTFFIKFYMAYWILAVAPAKTVVIQDQMTGQQKVISVSGGTGNAHLPLGVVLVNSYMSQFFNALITAYEQYFETGSSGQPGLGYTKSGMAFGSNFVSSANTFSSGDLQFDTNLQNYFANCALPVANNSGAITSMAQSGDLLQYFKDNFRTQQQVRYVMQLVGTNNVQTVTRCDMAVDNLSTKWTTMNDDVLTHLAKQLGFNDSPTLYGNFIAAGGVTANQLLGVSGGMSGAVKQAIAMNIAYKAIQTNAMQVNASSLANAAYDAQQFQQYKAGGELSGEMAARIVPALKIFAESLLFMFYPFMVFYCLISSNFMPFLKYMKFVATVNAIPFVYEVLNATINWYAQQKSGQMVTDGGFTLMNASNLYALNANIVAAANYLSMSAPLLAYALVHGSDMALTSLFGHSTDPGKSSASSTGSEAGKGNMNLGNSQLDNSTYGNVNANKVNTQFDMTGGADRVNRISSSGAVTQLGDSAIVSSVADQQKLGMSMNMQQMSSQAISNMKMSAHSEMGQASTAYQQMISSQHSKQSGASDSFAKELANNSSMGKDYQHAQTLGAEIKAGLTALGSGVGMTASARSSLTDKISELQSLSDKYSHTNNSAVNDVFSKMGSFSTSSQHATTDTWTAQQAETKLKSMGDSLSVNANNAFVQWAGDHGISGQQIADMSANKNGHNQAELKQLGERFMQDWITEMGGSNISVTAPNQQETMAKINKLGNQNASMPKDKTTTVDTSAIQKNTKTINDAVDQNVTNFNPLKESAKSSMQTVENSAAVAAGIAGEIIGGVNNATGGTVEKLIGTPNNPDLAVTEWGYRRVSKMPLNKTI